MAKRNKIRIQVKNLGGKQNQAPDGRWIQFQQINRVDEDHLPLHSTKISRQICYIIGITWNATYLSESGTRRHYKTFEDRMAENRRDILAEARRKKDSIIEWRYVYAHEKRLVKKAYPDAISPYPTREQLWEERPQ